LADQQDIGFVLDEAQRGEVFDQAPIQGWLGAEVELIEGAPRGQLGKAQSALQAALLDRGDFVGEQVVQELGVGGLVALSVFERGRESLGDSAQAQVMHVRA